MALGGVSSTVKLFNFNQDCVTFGKGKVEVKSWKCVVNLDGKRSVKLRIDEKYQEE